MTYDNQMTMVEATVSTIEELPTGRMATMDNGDRVPVSKKCKTGDRQRYARATPQLGRRGGNSAVGSWGSQPENGQDLQLPLGRSAAAVAFAFSEQSRTSKLLARLSLVADANTPGFISELLVAGQNLFCASRPANGFQFPLTAFDPRHYGQTLFNNADIITPAAVNLSVGGGFLNAQVDAVTGTWTTDLVPLGRLARYEAGDSQSTAGIGNINWAFPLEPALAIAAGANATLIGRVSRKPVTLGQLVIQMSNPATNTIIANNVGLTISEISVAGYPVFSATGVVPAAVFAAESADVRGAYLGKILADAGQEVSITVTNNTAVAVDVLAGIWCE